jgi:hypothetical protein
MSTVVMMLLMFAPFLVPLALEFSVGDVTETTISIALNFKAPNDVDSFVVKWQSDGATSQQFERSFQISQQSLVIPGLKPSTDYMITVTVRFRNGQEQEYVLSRQTEKLSGIKIDPRVLILQKGVAKSVVCLTALGAEPPNVKWLQNNTAVSNTTYISVYRHELILQYDRELNGAIFECKVDNFTAFAVSILDPQCLHHEEAEGCGKSRFHTINDAHSPSTFYSVCSICTYCCSWCMVCSSLCLPACMPACPFLPSADFDFKPSLYLLVHIKGCVRLYIMISRDSVTVVNVGI